MTGRRVHYARWNAPDPHTACGRTLAWPADPWMVRPGAPLLDRVTCRQCMTSAAYQQVLAGVLRDPVARSLAWDDSPDEDATR